MGSGSSRSRTHVPERERLGAWWRVAMVRFGVAMLARCRISQESSKKE
jgi:hypothetical protein